MYKRLSRLCLLAGFALLVFAGLLAALHAVGTDAALYEALQLRAGVLDTAGIDHETLTKLDTALARYLKGDPEALKIPAPEGSGRAWIFNDRENAHMADCFRLFVLLRRSLRACLVAGAALVALGWFMCSVRPEGGRGGFARVRAAAWLAPLVVLVPLAAFAAWAAADFDAAFNAFHGVLFTNDLWLLDPRTDLLIRICPASMFMEMGVRVAAGGLACALGLPLAVTLATLIMEKRTK